MASYVHPTAVIHPNVELGVNHWIGPYAVIGFPGQIRRQWNPSGRVVIGDNAVIHEHTSIQSGSEAATEIGNDVMLMCFTHVAHDCLLGDRVTMAGHANLAGHTTLEDWVFLGSHAVTHQHARIRKGSMLGAQSFLKGETGEWELWYGIPARPRGFNHVGWQRYTEGHASDLGARSTT